MTILAQILAYLTAAAMAWCGTGTIPEVPVEQNTVTIENIQVVTGGETFAPDLALTMSAAVGSQQADASLAVTLDGEVLFPTALRMTADDVRVKMGDAEGAYVIPADALTRYLGLDEEDAALMAENAEMMLTWAEYQESAQDPAQSAKLLAAWTGSVLEQTQAEGEPCTVEIGDMEAAAVSYRIELTSEIALTAIDAMADSGDESVKGMMDLLLKMLGGEDVTSFAELNDYIGDDESVPVVLTLAEADGYALTRLELMPEGLDEPILVQYTLGAECGSALFSVNITDEDDALIISVGNEYTMAEGELDSCAASMLLITESGFADEEAGSEEDGKLFSESVVLTIGASYENGLWDASLSYSSNLHFSASYVEEVYMLEDTELNESTSFYASYSEEAGADDTVVGSVYVQSAVQDDMQDGIENTTEVSFDIVRGTEPYTDAFEGREPITVNDADMNDPGKVVGMDIEAYMGDFAKLGESAELNRILEFIMMPAAYTDPYGYEEEEGLTYTEEESIDPKDMDEESVFVQYELNDISELADYYTGSDLPKITLPEGAVLGEVYADGENTMFDVYVLDEDGEFLYDIMLNNWDMELTEDDIYVFDDDVRTELNGRTVIYTMESGSPENVLYATVYLKDGTLMFYFGGATQEYVDEVLAGLSD